MLVDTMTATYMPMVTDHAISPVIKGECEDGSLTNYFTADFQLAVQNALRHSHLGGPAKLTSATDQNRGGRQEGTCSSNLSSIFPPDFHAPDSVVPHIQERGTKRKRKGSTAQGPCDARTYCSDQACFPTPVSACSGGDASRAPNTPNAVIGNDHATEVHIHPGRTKTSNQRAHANQKSAPSKARQNGSQRSNNGAKRKRESSDQGDRQPDGGHEFDEHNDPDENDVSDVSQGRSVKLLACHFNKRDPSKFRGPGKFKACQNGFLGFNRLKQHLRTVHQPKSYCVGCESIFESQDEKDNHDRDREDCERRRTQPKKNTFDEMITTDRQREALKRKLVSVSTSTHWFDMWKCLNGDLPQPASPYKESSLDAMDFVSFVKQRTFSYAQDFVLRANAGMLTPQLLTNFAHGLLDRAAADYLQQNVTSIPPQSSQSPQTMMHDNLIRPGDLDVFQMSTTNHHPVLESSPIDGSVINPGLSPNKSTPTIIVTEEGRNLDLDNNSWNPNGMDYWIVEDSMLGNVSYSSQGMMWISPEHEQTTLY